MFTPIETALGALLLHQASSAFLYYNGSVLGAAGLLQGLLNNPNRNNLALYAGMALSLATTRLAAPRAIPIYPAIEASLSGVLGTFAIGGLMGWGTKKCNGCTSGHMLCGLARRSGRSMIAVAAFFPAALAAYSVLNPAPAGLYSAATALYRPEFPPPARALTLLVLALCTVGALHALPRAVQHLTRSSSSARLAADFACGYAFGQGILLSGMACPAKVRGFFALGPALAARHHGSGSSSSGGGGGLARFRFDAYAWDPSLALVLLFAVIPNFLAIRWLGLAGKPRFADRFGLPQKTVADVDAWFLLGAVVFGVAWGLTGTCTGPAALRAVVQPSWGLLWMAGFWAGGRVA